MKEVIFFSNNKNKIIKFNNFFSNSNIKILNLNNFKKIKSPEENGLTFEDNAHIKSLYGYKKFNKICFADDSGICIEALNNRPGVKSKKFLISKKCSNEIFTDIINIAKKRNSFKASFITVICLSINESRHMLFKGSINGEISQKIKGINGFGYDPIFIPDGHESTFAEMGKEKKNLISHRAIAIYKLKKYLISI